SGVEWPKPEELAIGMPGVPRTGQPAHAQSAAVYRDTTASAVSAAAQPALPPAPADDRVVIRDIVPGVDTAPAPAPAQAQAPQKPSDAVANRPLELQSDGSATAAAAVV